MSLRGQITRKPTIYLSGKMTGLPNDNIERFEQESARLRGLGYEVFSPHTISKATQSRLDPKTPTWQDYLKDDLSALTVCDKIAVMENYLDSRGASFEVFIAWVLGIEILSLATLEPIQISSFQVIGLAVKAVHG